MPINVAIAGNYGSGKSSSIFPVNGNKGLPPEETYIISGLNKDLPFPGFKKIYKETTNEVQGNISYLKGFNEIIRCFRYIQSSRPEIKYIVFDDFLYILSKQLLEKATEKGYDKYNIIAKEIYMVFNETSIFSNDTYIFFMLHEEETDTSVRMKSISTFIDKLMNFEGLFTYLIYTNTIFTDKGAEYKFITNAMNNDRGLKVYAKTPIGCFKDIMIPNDLGLVVDTIDRYRLGE